jgi:hypothetical protein
MRFCPAGNKLGKIVLVELSIVLQHATIDICVLVQQPSCFFKKMVCLFLTTNKNIKLVNP